MVTYTGIKCTNQSGVCQPGELCNVQKAKVEKGKHWLQRLRQTTGGKNQIGCLHPIHL